MCWAVPARLIEMDGELGKVELGGTVREVGLQLMEGLAMGDYVLVHAGFAIQKVDRDEAEATLALLNDVFGAPDERHEVR